MADGEHQTGPNAPQAVPAAAPDTPTPAPTLTTRCPRCGYDLRGTVATWAESCPLTGVCSECGLTLSWPDVLMPQKYEPLWCIEFAPRRPRRKVPLAALWTFGRSFWPWGFWSRVRMSHAVRPRRLLVYLLLLVLPLVVMYPVVQGVGAVRMWNAVNGPIDDQSATLRTQAARFQNWQNDSQLARRVRDAPSELSRAAIIRDFQQQSAYLQNEVANIPTVSITRGQAIAEALVRPFSKTSTGVIRDPGGTVAYPAPSQLFDMVEMSQYLLRRWRGQVAYGWGLRWHPIFGLLALDGPATLLCGLSILYPLSMMLAPVTLRRAKVRLIHLLRVTIYGMWIPALLMYVAVLASIASTLLGGEPGFLSRHALAFIAGGTLVVLLWWAAAIRCYLRLPRPEFVAAMLAVLTLLAFAGAWYVAGEYLGWVKIDWYWLNQTFGLQ